MRTGQSAFNSGGLGVGPGLLLGLTMAFGASAQSVEFVDVTVEAGLDYLQWDGEVPRGEFGPDLEMLFMAAGAAPGDYDNDGWIDLYVTRLLAPNLLFRNNGDGTFTELGKAAGVDLVARSSGCAWADIDDDGDLDLYVLTMDRRGRNYMYINEGDGTFSESAIVRGVAERAANATFGHTDRFPTVLCPRCCTSTAFGDYDLDGDLDLAITDWGKNEVSHNRLFRNNGQGFFQNVTSQAGVSMPFVRGFAPHFADVTGNGYPDLLIAADFGTSRLFMNVGGVFVNATSAARVGTDENGMGSTVGDFDGDGDLDWFVTSIWDPDDICQNGQNCNWGTTGNRLYRNRTIPNIPVSIRFEDATDDAGVRDGAWGWGASFLDFDNDGDLDLGMTNGMVMPGMPWEDVYNNDRTRLWENDGTGSMTEVGEIVGFDDTRSGKGFVVFDYDNDGDQDIYIANNAEFPVLYRNDGGNVNNWLKVSLNGTATNRMGVGARISLQVSEGGPIQVREVSCDSNYMSHNETVEHFGVGAATQIHSIRVYWPVSRTQQTFNDIPVNQHIVIDESE